MITTKHGKLFSVCLFFQITLGASVSFTAIADTTSSHNSKLTQLEEEPLSKRSAEPDLDTVTSGTLFFNNNNTSTMAPILSSSVNTQISGMVAKVILEQTFLNNSTQWVEGLYTFPLPDQAAVNAMEVLIGERRITGKITEKEQANHEYTKAKNEGRVAGLVSQHRPNLFSSRFANIAPGEKISIKLTYIQTVSFENAKYRLRIPLTLTPRFSNSLVTDAAAISPPFVDNGNTREPNTIDHSVTLSGIAHGQYDSQTFASPSHSLNINASIDQINFSAQNTVKLDRDFILEWQIPNGTEPVARVWRELVGDNHYLLSSIVPPKNIENIPEQARELILVIDTSGSMAGEAIEAAKNALMSALSGLRDTDKFNIIEFNSYHSSMFNRPQFASEENIVKAQSFINRLRADGGTQMLSALEHALGYQQSGLLRQVVFVTDGSIGYEDTVITAITKQLRAARLFTVGIGSAPNQWFMRKVAQAGRGSAEFISHIDEVVPVMGDLLYKLEAPALTNIVVEFDDPKTNFVPNPIPDLYANDAVIIAAKLGEQSQSFKISGNWGDTLWEKTIDLSDAPLVKSGLSTIWAQRSIESLENQQRTHSVPDYYRSAILAIALEHKLLSQYTSFLAVEEQPVRSDENKLKAAKVPNLIPHGNDMLTIAMPQGSAGSDTRLLLSLILIILSTCSVYFQVRNKRQHR